MTSPCGRRSTPPTTTNSAPSSPNRTAVFSPLRHAVHVTCTTPRRPGRRVPASRSGLTRGHVGDRPPRPGQRALRRDVSRPAPAAPELRLASSPAWTRGSTCSGRSACEIGDAHLIRNAGGIPTDDVLRSLALSQRALGTREVVDHPPHPVRHGRLRRRRVPGRAGGGDRRRRRRGTCRASPTCTRTPVARSRRPRRARGSRTATRCAASSSTWRRARSTEVTLTRRAVLRRPASGTRSSAPRPGGRARPRRRRPTTNSASRASCWPGAGMT